MKRLIIGLTLVALVLVGVGTVEASTLEIQLTGLDLVFDGSSVMDAGGSSNPANADRLNTVTFIVDGNPLHTLLDDIFVDFEFQPIADIPISGDTVDAGSGTFDLLLPGIGLALDMNDVSLTCLPLSPTSDFAFAGSLASISAQNLPFDLIIDDPVTVSFSTQIDQATLTDDGTNITGFAASGTGEIAGQYIPEPSTLALLLTGIFGILLHGRRQRG